MNKKIKWLLGVGLVLAIAGGGGAFAVHKSRAAKAEKAQKEKLAGPVVPQFLASDVGSVELREMAKTIEATGSLAAERTAMVRSKAAAEVRSISVREGESVAQGQVVATLDTTDLQQRIRGAEGALQSAEARERNARGTRAMQKSLLDQNFISASAFDAHDASFKAAEGDLVAARSQVALAKNAASDAVVKAPMSGVVAKRFVNAGEKIGFDAPIVQIVDLRSLELQAFAAPEAAGSLMLGQMAEVTVAGYGQTFKGSLARVLPQVDASTRQLGLVIRLSGAGQGLKGGLDASARLRTEHRRALTLPASALQSSNGEAFVWMLKPLLTGMLTGTTTLVRLAVKVGARDDVTNVAEVLSGPAARASVLVGRHQGLKDGQTIVLMASGPMAAAPAASATAAVAATSAPAASAQK